MKYTPPIGESSNAPYIDANPSTGQAGSIVPAGALENPQREIVHVIESAGLTPSASDNTQLTQAINQKISTAETALSAAISQSITELATDAEYVAGTATNKLPTVAQVTGSIAGIETATRNALVATDSECAAGSTTKAPTLAQLRTLHQPEVIVQQGMPASTFIELAVPSSGLATYTAPMDGYFGVVAYQASNSHRRGGGGTGVITYNASFLVSLGSDTGLWACVISRPPLSAGRCYLPVSAGQQISVRQYLNDYDTTQTGSILNLRFTPTLYANS